MATLTTYAPGDSESAAFGGTTAAAALDEETAARDARNASALIDKYTAWASKQKDADKITAAPTDASHVARFAAYLAERTGSTDKPTVAGAEEQLDGGSTSPVSTLDSLSTRTDSTTSLESDVTDSSASTPPQAELGGGTPEDKVQALKVDGPGGDASASHTAAPADEGDEGTDTVDTHPGRFQGYKGSHLGATQSGDSMKNVTTLSVDPLPTDAVRFPSPGRATLGNNIAAASTTTDDQAASRLHELLAEVQRLHALIVTQAAIIENQAETAQQTQKRFLGELAGLKETLDAQAAAATTQWTNARGARADEVALLHERIAEQDTELEGLTARTSSADTLAEHYPKLADTTEPAGPHTQLAIASTQFPDSSAAAHGTPWLEDIPRANIARLKAGYAQQYGRPIPHYPSGIHAPFFSHDTGTGTLARSPSRWVLAPVETNAYFTDGYSGSLDGQPSRNGQPFGSDILALHKRFDDAFSRHLRSGGPGGQTMMTVKLSVGDTVATGTLENFDGGHIEVRRFGRRS
jgi:hypothetical protein